MNLSFEHIYASMGIPAKLVVVTLLVLLVWSVYVTIERLLFFAASRGQSRSLAAGIGGPLAKSDLDGALKLIASYPKAYLGTVLKAGLMEFKNRPDKYGVEAMVRVLERVQIEQAASLRKGLNILATTGSTAPFVGLVGTIFGIINAFTVMSTVGGGDLTAISGGIAEALVTTAVGIAVAIVGVWVYNYFNAVIDDISKDMTTSIGELVDWAEKDALRRSDGQAAK